jgi:hypothetical protein
MRTRRTTIKARAKSYGLWLLRTINQYPSSRGRRDTDGPNQSGAPSTPGSRLRALRRCHGVPRGAGRIASRRAHVLRRRCWRPTPPRLRLLLLHQAGADAAGGMTARPAIFTQRGYQKTNNVWFVGSRHRHNHSRLSVECTLDAACRTYHVRQYLPCSWR